MARTFTQHLLDINDRDTTHSYAHVLSTVAVSLKLMSAIISRGCLNLSGGGMCRDNDETNRVVRSASVDTLLEQAEQCDQLSAISFADDPEIYQISQDARCLLAMDVLHRPTALTENQPVGVTFSIIGRECTGSPASASEFLRPSSELLCAGLALFGPTSVLIVTTGDGVDGFTLDRDVGNYVLTHPQMTLPAESDVLAIDLSHASMWAPPIRRYVDERIRDSQEPDGRPAIMRWNNSAVLGAFRVLLNGGLFMLPQAKDADRSGGVPLVHTAAPLARLIEQAGGSATDGTNPISSLQPSSLDEHSPLILGAAGDVARIEQYAEEPEEGSEIHYPLFHNRTLFVQDH